MYTERGRIRPLLPFVIVSPRAFKAFTGRMYHNCAQRGGPTCVSNAEVHSFERLRFYYGRFTDVSQIIDCHSIRRSISTQQTTPFKLAYAMFYA